MTIDMQTTPVASDVTVVVAGGDLGAGAIPADAVRSVLRQTVRPREIIVVVGRPDDAEADFGPAGIGIRVVRCGDPGMAAARNVGIGAAGTPYVAVLDGRDRLLPRFLERTLPLLRADPSVAAASGWIKCFGVLDAVVCPSGGTIADFLVRNCCPSACVMRRDLWDRRGGYDESMPEGFEDWELFIGLLEAGGPDARIEVVDEPLVNRLTAAGHSGAKEAQRRRRALAHIIARHREAYAAHVESTVLALDDMAGDRLRMWEDAVQVHPELLQHSMRTRAFMDHPTYGDGGVEAAVRIGRARCSAPFHPAEA